MLLVLLSLLRMSVPRHLSVACCLQHGCLEPRPDRHFFFQAEDGIRDGHVTGVQTCALPICRPALPEAATGAGAAIPVARSSSSTASPVGRERPVAEAISARVSAPPASRSTTVQSRALARRTAEGFGGGIAIGPSRSGRPHREYVRGLHNVRGQFRPLRRRRQPPRSATAVREGGAGPGAPADYVTWYLPRRFSTTEDGNVASAYASSSYSMPGMWVTERTVQVPLDWAAPDGERIDLFIRELVDPDRRSEDRSEERRVGK